MRIAIYDNNIADRRYAEKLLGRESDRLHAEGREGHITDCLGSTEKVYHSADTYDMIMLGTSGGDAFDIAEHLRGGDILAPILFCFDEGAETVIPDEPWAKNTFALSKPYSIENLSGAVNLCGRHLAPAKPRIELHTDTETIHVRGSEIMYACEREQGYLTVMLKNGSDIRIKDSARCFFEYIQGLGEAAFMFPVSGRAFVNSAFIKKAGLLHVEMTDSEKLTVAPVFAANIREYRKR